MRSLNRRARVRVILAGALTAVCSPATLRADTTPECNRGTGSGTLECGVEAETGDGAGFEAAWATAVGNLASALADQAVAIGYGAVAWDVAGSQATTGQIAIGFFANSEGHRAIALGANAAANYNLAIAVGGGAQALAAGAVAIGANSVAATADTVSFGHATLQRRLVNVAAGVGATDAVNKAQLDAAIAGHGSGWASSPYVAVNSVGPAANATGAEAIAIGSAGTEADNAIAIGFDTFAGALGAVALGADASAEGVGAVALGPHARAYRGGSIALGSGSIAEADDAVVIGHLAQVTGANSVALGAGSLAAEDHTVAVGAANTERRIVHLADGISATDAVNKGQLDVAYGRANAAYALAESAKADAAAALAAGGTGGSPPPYVAVNSAGPSASATGTEALAIGASSEASKLAAGAIGFRAKALGINSTAIGADAQAQVDNALAVGAGAIAGANFTTAIGRSASATGDSATALGRLAKANGANSAAFGTGATAAAQGVAFGQTAQATGTNSTALGQLAQATQLLATAVGNTAQATATNATAIGSKAKAIHVGATAVGAGAVSTRDNQVTLGGAGSSVRIGDIAASTAAQSGPVYGVTVDGSGTLGRTQVATAGDVERVMVAMDYVAAVTDQQFSALEGQVSGLAFALEDLDQSTRGGIAAAMALGGTMVVPDSTVSVSLNASTYRGEQGFAGSVTARLAPRVYAQAGIAGSSAKNSTGGRVGVAFGF